MNIVFDLDGTLIDSAPDIRAMTAAVLKRWNCAALSLEETRQFIGEGAAVFVRRMMAARDIEDTQSNFDAVYEDFVARYKDALGLAIFNPGVEEILRYFTEQGFRLGLCTNKPEQGTMAVLQHMKIKDHFLAVVAGDMMSSRKPEPDMLLATIKQLGGGTSLFVGDSEIDALTAQRAQVPFALFTGGYRKQPASDLHHDWLIDDFRELSTIAEQLNNSS